MQNTRAAAPLPLRGHAAYTVCMRLIILTFTLAGTLLFLSGCCYCPDESPASDSQWTPIPFDAELSRWQPLVFGADGEITIEDGVLHLQMGGPMTGVKYKGDASELLGEELENFVIEFAAKRIEGFDFFVGLTFPVGNQGHATLIMGGWGGSLVGLSSLGFDDASSNETTQLIKFEQDRWYAVRLEVSSEYVTCHLDGEQLFAVERAKYEQFTLRGEVLDTAPFGLCCFQSHAAIRSFQVRQIEKD